MAVVQVSSSCTSDIAGGTQTLLFGTSPVVGDEIVVFLTGLALVANASAPFSVSDSAGNTYSLDGNSHSVYSGNASFHKVATAYRATVSATGTSFTITITTPSNSGSIDGVAVELPSVLTLDKVETAQSTSTAPAGGTTGVLTFNPEIVFAIFSAPGAGTPTITKPTGTTLLYQDAATRPAGVAYERVTATTAVNPAWTLGSSAEWAALTVTYKDAVVLPGAPTITLAIGATDVVSVTAAATAGDFAINHYLLLESATPGAETTTGVTATPGSYPLAFTGQTKPTAGNAKYYVVQTIDANGNASPNSVEVSDRVTGLVASGVTYNRLSQAAYGAAAAGLAGQSKIGYTVLDPTGAVLAAHTYSGVVESPDPLTNRSGVTGVYTVMVNLDYNWVGTILWDTSGGVTPASDPFDAQPLPDGILDSVTVGTSATVFTGTTALSATTNAYQKMYVEFLSGALRGQCQEVSSYTGVSGGTGGIFTMVSGFTAAPSVGDAYKVIGRGT